MNLEPLIHWYNHLSSAELDRLPVFYHEEAEFSDPFNQVQGQAAIRAIFQHMFDSLGDPQFSITDSHSQGQTAWLSWDFHAWFGKRPLHWTGVSRLDFGPDGRVIRHRDYCDALVLFEQMPFLSKVIHFLRCKMQVKQAHHP
jgi:hypothetical protein